MRTRDHVHLHQDTNISGRQLCAQVVNNWEDQRFTQAGTLLQQGGRHQVIGPNNDTSHRRYDVDVLGRGNMKMRLNGVDAERVDRGGAHGFRA